MWEYLFESFMKRNQLAVGHKGLKDIFILAFFANDVEILEQIISDYPGFGDYLSYLKSGQQMTDEELWSLPDTQYCAMSELRMATQGTLSDPEDEIHLLNYLMQWSDLRAVADIGCGSCQHLLFLKERGIIKGRAFGIDASLPALKVAQQIARREGIDISFAKSHCSNLPLLSGSIDQVWMITLLMWVIEWEQALVEAARALTPKGRIILVITDSKRRSRVSYQSATGFLERIGFHIDDVTQYGKGCYYIAAGKRERS